MLLNSCIWQIILIRILHILTSDGEGNSSYKCLNYNQIINHQNEIPRGKNMSLPKSPDKITDLLISSDPKDKERGYKAFLKRTHWHTCADPDHLKKIACKQLGVASNKVFASKIKRIEPGLLWASQSGLEADKLKMVEVAYNYVKQIGEEFPPIVIWDFFDNQKMRKIVHDGHHRTYFSYRMSTKLRAVILEPLGNYDLVQHKFRYAFQISRRVIDLPVLPSFSSKKLNGEEARESESEENSSANSSTNEKKDNRCTDLEENQEKKHIENKIADKKLQHKKNKKVSKPEKLNIPAKVKNERFSFTWDYIKVKNFGSEELKHFDILDVTKMFRRRNKPMVPELAYLSFLLHSRWGKNFDIERGVRRTQMQLRLPLYDGEGLSHHHRKLNPGKIWASQDSLDKEVLEMVEMGMRYMLDSNKPIPPVIVWLIKDSSRYNYVCHDGHHRIYVAYLMKMPIPAVILEYWIDNRDDPLLRKKIPYERVDSYVKDLPIEKFEGVRYTLREKYKQKQKKIHNI